MQAHAITEATPIVVKRQRLLAAVIFVSPLSQLTRDMFSACSHLMVDDFVRTKRIIRIR